MKQNTLLVALEIGSSKIGVAVGKIMKDGTLSVIGVGQAPSRGVRKGEIVDLDTAKRCVYDALVDAEEKSGQLIESVTLALSGSHINSINNRGTVLIAHDKSSIDAEDCIGAEADAVAVQLPEGTVLLSSVLQRYFADGREILNPVGVIGRRLESDFHIIYGQIARIQLGIRCVQELGLEVEDVVFAGLASAFAVLDQTQKNIGTLVIDLGAGTTDYVVYLDGVINASGVLGVGGDHINQDLAVGLRMPWSRAERLKKQEGRAYPDPERVGHRIALKDDYGLASLEVELDLVNVIIQARVQEIFEVIKGKLLKQGCFPFIRSVTITGGTSRLREIDRLAEAVFELPVNLVKGAQTTGVNALAENPEFSAILGTMKYAQALQPPETGGLIGKALKWLMRKWRQ